MNNSDIIFTKKETKNLAKLLVFAFGSATLAALCSLIPAATLVRSILEVAAICLIFISIQNVTQKKSHTSEMCPCCHFSLLKDLNYCPSCGTRRHMKISSIDDFERKQYTKEFYEMATQEQKKSENQLLEDFPITPTTQVPVSETDILNAFKVHTDPAPAFDYLNELED